MNRMGQRAFLRQYKAGTVLKRETPPAKVLPARQGRNPSSCKQESKKEAIDPLEVGGPKPRMTRITRMHPRHPRNPRQFFPLIIMRLDLAGCRRRSYTAVEVPSLPLQSRNR